MRDGRGRRTGYAKALAATALVVGGTIGMASAASARAHATTRHSTHAKKAVVLQHYKCTVVATKKHPSVVGHAGDVVCGLKGNDTLKAVGPGIVVLVAGPGKDTLIGSSDPGAQDKLVGGAGNDTLDAGSGGSDVIDTGSGSDAIDCSSGTSTVTVVGDDQGDSENQDCQGDNADNAAMQFEGSVISVSPLTMKTSDQNDSAGQWLQANPSCNPASLVIDTSQNPTIETDSGGPIAVGDDIEVEANAPASGCSPVAVTIQAQSGDSSSQGDDNAQGEDGGGDSSCPGGTVTGSVEGDLSVTSGSCTVTGADVQGDLTVAPGASATITNTTIEGDLTCDGSVTDGGGNSVQGDVSGSCPSSIASSSSGDGNSQ